MAGLRAYLPCSILTAFSHDGHWRLSGDGGGRHPGNARPGDNGSQAQARIAVRMVSPELAYSQLRGIRCATTRHLVSGCYTVGLSGANRCGRDVCSDDFRENPRASSAGSDDTHDALICCKNPPHGRVRGLCGYSGVFAYAPHDRVRVGCCTTRND